MIIIGVTGPIASGDDEFGNVAKERDYGWGSYSDCLRGLLREWKREVSRSSLQDLADDIRMIDPEILSKIVHSSMNVGNKYCTGNLRNPFEVDYFRRWERQGNGRKFSLVHIDAYKEIRFERARKREAERREGDPLTLEEFEIMEAKDLGIGQPWYGQQHLAVFRLADYKIENNGTLKELGENIHELLTRIENSL